MTDGKDWGNCNAGDHYTQLPLLTSYEKDPVQVLVASPVCYPGQMLHVNVPPEPS